MKKFEIKNPQRFSLGLASAVIGVGLMVISDWSLAVIFLLGAVTCFATAFSEDVIVDRVEKGMKNRTLDERDHFIALRAGRQTLRIMYWLLIGGWLLLRFGGKLYPDAIIMGDTLLIIFYVLILVSHLTNLYYEKHC